MVIRDISKFFHHLIQRLLCLEIVQFDAFIFQCVKISFHRSVVVRAPCFAHALAHMDRFTEFHKCLWRILGTLIAVENQFFSDLRLCFQSFPQSSDGKAAGNLAVCHTCNDALVIQVNYAANEAHFSVFQKQICEIRAPLLVRPVCMKLLMQPVFKDFVRFPAPVSCHSVMRMVNFPDQRFCCFFPGIIISLPVFPIVVIGILADAKPPQPPADAEIPVVLFNKPISL